MKCSEDDRVRCCSISISKVIDSTTKVPLVMVPTDINLNDNMETVTSTMNEAFYEMESTTISKENDIHDNPFEEFELSNQYTPEIIQPDDSNKDTVNSMGDVSSSTEFDLIASTVIPTDSVRSVDEFSDQNALDVKISNDLTTMESSLAENMNDISNIAHTTEMNEEHVMVPNRSEEIQTLKKTKEPITDIIMSTESVLNQILDPSTQRIAPDTIISRVKATRSTIPKSSELIKSSRFSNYRRRHLEQSYSANFQTSTTPAYKKKFRSRLHKTSTTTSRTIDIPEQQFTTQQPHQFSKRNKANALQRKSSIHEPIIHEHEEIILGVHKILAQMMQNTSAINSKLTTTLITDKHLADTLNGLKKLSRTIQSNRRMPSKHRRPSQSYFTLKNNQMTKNITQVISESFETTTMTKTKNESATIKRKYKRRRLPDQNYSTKSMLISNVTVTPNENGISTPRTRYTRRKQRIGTSNTEQNKSTEQLQNNKVKSYETVNSERKILFTSRKKLLSNNRNRISSTTARPENTSDKTMIEDRIRISAQELNTIYLKNMDLLPGQNHSKIPNDRPAIEQLQNLALTNTTGKTTIESVNNNIDLN